MKKIGRATMLALVMTGWASAGSSEATASSVCLPPYWGGLLAGMSTEAEVKALYGEGQLGESGGRSFVDSSKSATLIIEFGTDRVVSSVEVREGLPPGLTAGTAKRLVAARFQPRAGIGVHFGLHLGASRDAVRGNLGAPSSSRSDSDGEIWTYDSSCGCELPAGLSFRFVAERLVGFSVWQLNG